MSNFPRRSPRFQQQSGNTPGNVGSIAAFGSPFSQVSSTTSTSHPSPTSDNLTLANQPQQYPLQIQSHFLAPAHNFDVPLPSPSAGDLDPFGRSQIPYQYQYQCAMGGQAQNQNATNSHQISDNQNQSSNSQQQLQLQQQQQHHHNSFTQPQKANYPPTSTHGTPPGLPPDFLAEAAKRAQMACLMRDLGDVSL